MTEAISGKLAELKARRPADPVDLAAGEEDPEEGPAADPAAGSLDLGTIPMKQLTGISMRRITTTI